MGYAPLQLLVESVYPLGVYALTDLIDVVDHAHEFFVANYEGALLAGWADHFGFYLGVADAHDLLANRVVEMAYRLIFVLILLLDGE